MCERSKQLQRLHRLSPFEEVHIFCDKQSPVGLRLCQSDANSQTTSLECFGIPLLPSQWYFLPPGASVGLCTLSGAVVEVAGPQAQQFVTKSNASMYSALLNLTLTLNQTRVKVFNQEVHTMSPMALDETRKNYFGGPRVMFVGSPFSGKSTAAQLLCNYSLRTGWKPICVTLDSRGISDKLDVVECGVGCISAWIVGGYCENDWLHWRNVISEKRTVAAKGGSSVGGQHGWGQTVVLPKYDIDSMINQFDGFIWNTKLSDTKTCSVKGKQQRSPSPVPPPSAAAEMETCGLKGDNVLPTAISSLCSWELFLCPDRSDTSMNCSSKLSYFVGWQSFVDDIQFNDLVFYCRVMISVINNGFSSVCGSPESLKRQSMFRKVVGASGCIIDCPPGLSVSQIFRLMQIWEVDITICMDHLPLMHQLSQLVQINNLQCKVLGFPKFEGVAPPTCKEGFMKNLCCSLLFAPELLQAEHSFSTGPNVVITGGAPQHADNSLQAQFPSIPPSVHQNLLGLLPICSGISDPLPSRLLPCLSSLPKPTTMIVSSLCLVALYLEVSGSSSPEASPEGPSSGMPVMRCCETAWLNLKHYIVGIPQQFPMKSQKSDSFLCLSLMPITSLGWVKNVTQRWNELTRTHCFEIELVARCLGSYSPSVERPLYIIIPKDSRMKWTPTTNKKS